MYGEVCLYIESDAVLRRTSHSAAISPRPKSQSCSRHRRRMWTPFRLMGDTASSNLCVTSHRKFTSSESPTTRISTIFGDNRHKYIAGGDVQLIFRDRFSGFKLSHCLCIPSQQIIVQSPRAAPEGAPLISFLCPKIRFHVISCH